MPLMLTIVGNLRARLVTSELSSDMSRFMETLLIGSLLANGGKLSVTLGLVIAIGMRIDILILEGFPDKLLQSR